MRRGFIPHLLSMCNIFKFYKNNSRVIEYKKGAGFTLMEIMIVVAIVIILISLVVPSVLRSRVAANECATIANLRALDKACQAYHIDQQAYPDNLLTLSAADPPYIDNALGSGRKQGYEFVYESLDADQFSVHANPIHGGLLKGRYFYLDESSTIRTSKDGPAGPGDEAIG